MASHAHPTCFRPHPTLRAARPAHRARGRGAEAARALQSPTAERQAEEQRNVSTSARRPPYRVLITGSTKGIGRALVDEFLEQGDSVCVTSRSCEAVDAVVAELQRTHAKRVVGTVCDVRCVEGVEALAAFAVDAMGGVDIWINNAGSNGYSYAPLTNTDPMVLKEIVDTNVFGTLLCTRTAITLMAEQASGGHVFNMEGAGSDGGATVKYAAYGMSKAGMLQLTKSLAEETQGLPVGVHTLSPGLVYTDLVACGQNTFGSQGRFFINAIAESPDVVAADVVPKLRALVASPAGAKGGGAVRFLTPDKALVKLYRRIVKGENANRFFPDKDPAEEQARASAKLDLQAEVRKLAGRVVAMMGMIVFMIRD